MTYSTIQAPSLDSKLQKKTYNNLEDFLSNESCSEYLFERKNLGDSAASNIVKKKAQKKKSTIMRLLQNDNTQRIQTAGKEPKKS